MMIKVLYAIASVRSLNFAPANWRRSSALTPVGRTSVASTGLVSTASVSSNLVNPRQLLVISGQAVGGTEPVLTAVWQLDRRQAGHPQGS